MIRINLLPNEGKAKAGGRRAAAGAKAGAPSPAAPKAAAILLVGLVAAIFFIYQSHGAVSKAKSNVSALTDKKTKLGKSVDDLALEAGDIEEKLEILSYQTDILNSLDPPDRILWSQKLAMLSELIPADVFLTELDVEEQVKEVEIPASVEKQKKWEADGKEGTKPEVVRQPVITYSMTMRGLADGPSATEQFDNVLKFNKALVDFKTKDNHGQEVGFMTGFRPDIDIRSIESTLFEKQYPVTEFEFVLRTVPPAPPKPANSEGAAEPAPKKPAAKKPARKE